MRRTLFRSKIHRATVTQADLDYELCHDRRGADARRRHHALRRSTSEPHNGSHWRPTRSKASRLGHHLQKRRRAPARPGDIVIIATFAGAADGPGRAPAPHRRAIDAANRIIPTRRRGAGSAAPPRTVV
jgi:aspartate 1-decarboxylase